MKKSKKFLSVALAALLAAGSVATMAGCSFAPPVDQGGQSSSLEQADAKRTQLYVRNYQGGFGNSWLYNAKAKFEAKYEGVSLEDGKEGVQVIIHDKKETPQVTLIPSDIYEVYFVEKLVYLTLVNEGVVEDLTTIVTNTNPYDNNQKSIVSKLTEEQQGYWGVKEGTDTKYYALPHYLASMGIVYDKTMFKNRKFFFKKGYETETDLESKFIEVRDDERSAGPDGIEGNDDDGLPATYEDFWDLCEYIKMDGKMPLNWGGTGSMQFYVTSLMIQLMADYQGKDQFMMNFTYDGLMNDLAVLDSNGEMTFDANGNPITESVLLDPEKNNGYESFRHVSYYYALQFVKKLADTIGTYSIKSLVGTSAYDAFDAQDHYVSSKFRPDDTKENGDLSTLDQAMLIEGSWWDNEASKYFETNTIIYGDQASKANSNYGWLPLPKATREQVGKQVKNTMVNTIDSMCFVKTGMNKTKKDLAFDFVQMMHSDESLKDFTLETNAFKDFQYSLEPTQVSTLSNFGKEMHKFWSTWDIVNPNHNNAQYVGTVYATASSRRYAMNATDIFAGMVFSSEAGKNISAADYLESSFKYIKSSYGIWAKQ